MSNAKATPQPASEQDLDKIISSLNPYSDWHPEIKKLRKKHPGHVKYGGAVNSKTVESYGFQMVNFLAYHKNHAFCREDLRRVAEVLIPGKKSSDIIQSVNKMQQKGLRQRHFDLEGTRYYHLNKIEFDKSKTAARVSSLSKRHVANAEKISRRVYKDYSEGKFEIGHKDPRKPLTPENAALQPAPINRAYRDNFLVDDNGLPTIPNPDKFEENPHRFLKDKEDRLQFFRGLMEEQEENGWIIISPDDPDEKKREIYEKLKKELGE